MDNLEQLNLDIPQIRQVMRALGKRSLAKRTPEQLKAWSQKLHALKKQKKQKAGQAIKG